MAGDQPAVIEDQTEWRCHFCETTEGMLSPDICRKCLQQILHKHYPRLRRHLELEFGDIIDGWLSRYRLLHSNWEVTPDFQIKKESLSRLIREIVQEAVERRRVALNLTADDLWKPIRIDQLVDYLSKKCGDEINHYLKQVLTEAIPGAPTEEAERELIEVVVGKKRVKRYRRDEAVWLLTVSKALPFDSRAQALIEMRYTSDKAAGFYFDCEANGLNAIWRLIEDSLPVEIVKLIASENSY